MSNKVGNYELKFYFLVWIFMNLYALYNLWDAQNDILKQNDPSTIFDLDRGWILPYRYADNSDIEWITWKYFIRSSFIYLLFQYVVSEAIRSIKPPLLVYWYPASCIFFIAYNFGVTQLIFSLLQPCMYAVITFNGSKKPMIWVLSVILLLFYNYIKQNDSFWHYSKSEDEQDEVVYILLFAFGWIELRCISYSIDYIEKRASKSQKIHDAAKEAKIPVHSELMNMFAYVLYLPLFFTGPHVTYKEFEQSYADNIPWSEKIKWSIKNIIIFGIYTFLLEFAFHYIYFLAMNQDVKLLQNLSTIALCGGGLWMGLEFHMKYVISYGIAGALTLMDNIEPPPTPRCIVRVHVYSQMWRYFDVGLYKFLSKYIYKPFLSTISLHSKLHSSINKLLASLSAFIFIFMWHGATKAIFIWATLNYIGIMCESWAKHISKGEFYKEFKRSVLKTDAMEQRLTALLCAPLLAMSAVSNFYLFAGKDVGDLFVEHLCPPSFYSFTVLLLALYSCCHVSIALQEVPSRTSRSVKCN